MIDFPEELLSTIQGILDETNKSVKSTLEKERKAAMVKDIKQAKQNAKALKSKGVSDKENIWMDIVRDYEKKIKTLKEEHGIDYSDILEEEESVQSLIEKVLNEEAPPSEKWKKWLEDEKVQQSFKDQYGERWKEVMFAKAWKGYNDEQGE